MQFVQKFILFAKSHDTTEHIYPECVYENDKSARKAQNQSNRQPAKERPLNLGSSINSGVQEIREVIKKSNPEIREVIPQDEVQVVEQSKAKGRSTYDVR